MATEFQMPKLGLTMEAGTILQWLVDDGAEVAEGQPVLVIETDKVESEVEASGSGRLAQTGAIGETYDCGVQIGWFLAGDEPVPTDRGAAAPAAAPPPGPAAAAPSAAPQARATVSADGRLLASPNAKRIAAGLGIDITTVAGTGPGGRIVSEDVEALAATGGRLLASPNAKRVASELGIDIVAVRGTGPGGRIVSEDVEAAAAAPRAPIAAAPAVAAAPRTGALVLATAAGRRLADMLGIDIGEVPPVGADPRVTKEAVAQHVRTLLAAEPGARSAAVPAPPAMPVLQEPTDVIAFRGMRGAIAERMHGSLQAMAQLTLFTDVDMGAVIADRERRKADGTAPGFTDYVIAAAAAALVDHPHVNSQVTDDGVALLPDVHVGLAVALEGGLIVPVIRDTPSLDLDALSAETSRLAEAARSGKLGFDDLEGGTFSVTALGMFGVDGFTPVINPPNTAILGVGRLRDEVAWEGETPTKRTVLTLSLTWDHRAFDGAPAAEFARSVKDKLEAL